MPETSPNTLFKAAKMKSEEMQLPHTVEHVNRHCAGVDPPCIQCLATLIMSAKIITFHHILEFELWVMIEVHFSFIIPHTGEGIVRMKKRENGTKTP